MGSGKFKLQYLGIGLISILVGFAVYLYTSGVEERTQSQYSAIPVLLVTKQIAAGTTLQSAINDSAIVSQLFPASAKPDNSLDSLDSIDPNKVAVNTLQPGQILLVDSFGDYAQQTGSLTIPNGLVAVSVTLPKNARVGNFVQPGSRVTLYASGKPTEDGEELTQTIFAEILVLAIGDQVNPQSASTTGDENILVTFAATPSQAKKIVHASQNLSLYLALRGANVPAEESSPIRSNSILRP